MSVTVELSELDAVLWDAFKRGGEWVNASEYRKLMTQNAKLRELVRDMWREGMCECDERGACAQCEYHFPDRMRELGVVE